MHLTPRQKSILTSVLADVQHFRRQQPPERGITESHEERLEREAIELAKGGIVRCEPGRWLGYVLNGSDYVLLTRDYKALEARGLIRRHKLGFDGSRNTHIELTEEGTVLAKQLREQGPADG